MDIGEGNNKNINPEGKTGDNPGDKKGEKTEKTPSGFGRVIKALHKKVKLPSLRTYQGDMAEFIKDKDQSVTSVVVKEKEREQKREKEQEIELKKEEEQKKSGEITKVDSSIMFPKPAIESKPKGRSIQLNLTIVMISLLLILGGVVATFYVIDAFKTPLPPVVELKQNIIPYNNMITLANVTKSNFGSELAGLKLENGISVLQISGVSGSLFKKSSDLFDFLDVSLPGALDRSLKDDYVVAVISQNGEAYPFVILTVDDFGRAFSAMLDWEKNMLEDLSFLNPIANVVIPDTTASSTHSTDSTDSTNSLQANSLQADSEQAASTTEMMIPLKKESFAWKDIIIKNKDTRGLVNNKNQAQIAYTFLDKNTILIVGDLSVIGDISSIYASRSIVR